MLGQILVCFREMLAAEKALVSGKGRWVGTFQNTMLFAINQRLFAACVSAPKNKYNVFFMLGNQPNYAVGEPSPAAFGMGVGLVCANAERGIHEQNALVCPFRKVAVFRRWTTDIRFQLLEDIFQRGGIWNAVLYGKAKPMRLSLVVIRVLSE